MKYIFICLALLISNIVFGLSGKVISIADGDTLTVLTTDKQQVKVRLSGIDTPEKNQAYGTVAKQMLSGKVFGYIVKVEDHGKDQYGRTIGDVYLGDLWINLEMVKGGWAWHYKAYSDDERLAKAEIEARKARRGLWAGPDPMPPWEFRQRARSGNSETSRNWQTPAVTGYWLNTSSGVRHNSNCSNYKNTKRGRSCTRDEGRPGGCCGG